MLLTATPGCEENFDLILFQTKASLYTSHLWCFVSLPQSVKQSDTTLLFKMELKTHLFKIAFPT